MGEYAEYNGQRIKIGTCESMYYLRADQAHLVTALPGNVDPGNPEHLKGIRFRFPWPDEDGTEPGGFDNAFDRALVVPGVTVPDGVDHYTQQFKAAEGKGYLVSLPCPELSDRGVLQLVNGKEYPYKVGRNGFAGAVALCEQRWWAGLLVAVARCQGCGSLYRMPELSDAQGLIDGLHVMADAKLRDYERNDTKGDELAAVRLRSIADRVLAGYQIKQAAAV